MLDIVRHLRRAAGEEHNSKISIRERGGCAGLGSFQVTVQVTDCKSKDRGSSRISRWLCRLQ
jgi:hypothetical protein